MEATVPQRKKIHPHKFALWLAMASITMMFAGLTSGYIVRQSEGNWRYYKLPPVFYISTLVILLSSATFVLGLKAFKNRAMPRFKSMMLITLLMGLAFGALQFLGFYQLYTQPSPVKIAGNPSESFLFVIAGLHLVHILGGIVALAIVYLRTFRKKIKVYNAVPLEIVGGYWHFVDILWIYLFIFFLANQ
jgi:cytochrome c oxidase subunit 3